MNFSPKLIAYRLVSPVYVLKTCSIDQHYDVFHFSYEPEPVISERVPSFLGVVLHFYLTLTVNGSPSL